MHAQRIYSEGLSSGIYTWATKPAASAASGATIRISDVGPGGSLWTSNGSDWFPVGGIVTLAVSGANVPHTGTINETTLTTVSIPADIMGANGAIELLPLYDYTNSANTKTLKAKFGGGLVYSIATTTTTSCQMQYIVRNANSKSAQVAQASSGSAGMGAVASALLTGSINTANAVSLTITGQLANSGETINLRGYIVRLIK